MTSLGRPKAKFDCYSFKKRKILKLWVLFTSFSDVPLICKLIKNKALSQQDTLRLNKAVVECSRWSGALVISCFIFILLCTWILYLKKGNLLYLKGNISQIQPLAPCYFVFILFYLVKSV